MYQLTSPLEIYKHLPKTNCRQCDERTCLAFAAAVIQGRKKLEKCPYLDKDFIENAEVVTNEPVSLEKHMQHVLERLQREIKTVDFNAAAGRTGASLVNGNLVIKSLGRLFTVEPDGTIRSDCHVIPWVTLPLLSYIISSAGKEVSGTWVPFRELEKGATWLPLFEQRCEKPLKRIADNYTGLFGDLLEIFGGQEINQETDGEIMLVLYPLPKVPLLIKYKPKDELDSKLNIFFDRTAEDNLGVESLYLLCAGLVIMFEKIAMRHGK